MGTGAFKALSGDSAANYVAEEASKASKEAVTKAFTELSDSERQRVMDVLQAHKRKHSSLIGIGGRELRFFLQGGR